jgi:hypothetical protein
MEEEGGVCAFVCLCECARDAYHLIEIELLLGSRDESLLDRVLRDESVHIDGLRLSDTMASILRLEIDLRIEVTGRENGRKREDKRETYCR